jgi:hypothetical protein
MQFLMYGSGNVSGISRQPNCINMDDQVKTKATSRSAWFKLRVSLLVLSMAGMFLALFATANPQTVTRMCAGNGDVQVHGTTNQISFAPAESLQEAWVARYNGPGNDFDAAQAMAVDNSGNVYVTGRSSDPDFSTHYATVKYNSAGQELWVARYYGPANYQDAPTAIAVDESGNVYVTGYSFGSGNNYDYATIKYNPDGQEQWVARYNGPDNGDDGAEGIALDSSGSVYVTGSSVNATGFADYVTIKYNSAGQELARAYSTPALVMITAQLSTTQPANNSGSPVIMDRTARRLCDGHCG